MALGWTARTAAALVLAVAALSGCSGEQPANDTLPEPTAEATASAEALPPLGPPDFPVPAEAREKTPEGALEFTRYYISLLEHIGNGTLNPQPLLDLSLECSHCQQVADSLNRDREAGYRYGNLSVSFHGYGPGVISGEQAEVGFVYSQSTLTVYDTTGETVQAESAPATGDLQSGAFLVWRDDLRSWLITEMTIG